MHRFFVSSEAFEQEAAPGVQRLVVLSGDQAHQVRRVLRLRLGDRAILLNGNGWAYESILVAVGDDDVKFQPVRSFEAGGEPRTHITLFQAVLKGDHFAWALQKGTEIGVSRFVPLICQHNVVDDMEAIAQKRERWERILQEAAEQSGRGCLPELSPAQLFPQAVQPGSLPADPRWPAPMRLILWEAEQEIGLGELLAKCNLAQGSGIQVYVGPEGGFTSEEVHLARRYGIMPVSLGPRILRAETAGVVAAVLILHESGDMSRGAS